jgi:hypothetical protein
MCNWCEGAQEWTCDAQELAYRTRMMNLLTILILGLWLLSPMLGLAPGRPLPPQSLALHHGK